MHPDRTQNQHRLPTLDAVSWAFQSPVSVRVASGLAERLPLLLRGLSPNLEPRAPGEELAGDGKKSRRLAPTDNSMLRQKKLPPPQSRGDTTHGQDGENTHLCGFLGVLVLGLLFACRCSSSPLGGGRGGSRRGIRGHLGGEMLQVRRDPRITIKPLHPHSRSSAVILFF